MVDNHHLRAIILKLENRLSDDDRERLHFFLGDDVPRRIRDNPSLPGTLRLMESLFDQDKISEKDFTFLIDAFDAIQCMDAVKLLREHTRRIQPHTLRESVQSLATIMPPTIDLSIEVQEEDKYAMRSPLIDQRTYSDCSVETTTLDDSNKIPMTEIVRNPSTQSNQQKVFQRSSKTQKYLFISLLLLSITIFGALTTIIFVQSNRFTQKLKTNEKTIFNEQAKNNQVMDQLKTKEKTIFEEQTKNNQIIDELKSVRSIGNQTTQQLIDNQLKQNFLIQQLNTSRSMDNQTIENLNKQLERSLREQRKNNQTIAELNSLRSTDNFTMQHLNQQLEQTFKEQNKTIAQLNNYRLVDNQTIRQLTHRLKQSLKEHVQCNRTRERLTDKLQQSLREQTKSNQTIGQLINQLQQSRNEQTNHSRVIQELNNFRSKDNQTKYQLSDQLQQALKEQRRQNEMIAQLNVLRSKDNETIQQLINQWKEALEKSTRSDRNNKIVEKDEQIDLNQLTTSVSTQKTVSMGHPQINPNTKWKKYDSSVAKSMNEENGNKVLYPYGLEVDDDQTMIIADSSNHRILEWKFNAPNGLIVAGGNGSGNGDFQLKFPSNVIIDKRENKLIICDRYNKRVVRWARRGGQSGEIIIPHVKCFDLTMDIDRFLYISDIGKHEVRRWRIGESEGTLVAGGNGHGHGLHQFDNPQYIFIDRDLTLFVSDYQNHRVMKWVRNATEGSVVAGGNGRGNGLTHLFYPQGIFVDQSESLYVADCSHNRIMRWLKDAKQGSIIVGSDGEGNRTDQLNCPIDLSFDVHGNLYAADFYNHRVQKFDVDKI